MLGFSVGWDAQAGRLKCWLSLTAVLGFTFAFDFGFDVDEPGSRRGAEHQAALVMTIGCAACLSAASSAHPATIVMTSGAPQDIRPFGPDGGLGDSIFGYFFCGKSNSHQLTQ